MYASRPTRSDDATGPPTGKWGGGAATRPKGPGTPPTIYFGCIKQHPWMHTARYGSIGAMGILSRLLGAPAPEDRPLLVAAAAAIDRELAANIELASLWDQTHQAVVFENAEFTRHAAVLRRLTSGAFDFELLDEVYTRMPSVESAMERRGPVNSIKPEDKSFVETWEGDVREAQRGLRAAVAAPPPSAWALLMARLRTRGNRPNVR